MILTTPQPHDREMFEAIMSQLSRPLRVLEQSKPLSIAALTIAAPPNVFELPPQPGDPPLPWATEEWLALGDRPTVTARLSYALAYRGRRRRRSMLPFVVLATWLAIGIGVAVDEGARHDVSARVETARVRVTSVLARHAR